MQRWDPSREGQLDGTRSDFASIGGLQVVPDRPARDKGGGAMWPEIAHTNSRWRHDRVWRNPFASSCCRLSSVGKPPWSSQPTTIAGDAIRNCGPPGVDLDCRRQGQYMSPDAAETLATFMVGGMPDGPPFETAVGDLVRRIAASGEPT